MKRSYGVSTFISALLPALLILFALGCGMKQVASIWFTPASPDQDQPDWMNLGAYKLDPLDGSMTVVNDDSTLYVRFRSRDPRLYRRLQQTGLTVWFSGSETKSARLGIRYPLGSRNGMPEVHNDRFLPDAQLPPDEMSDLLAVQNDDLEIVTGDSTIHASNSAGGTESLGIGATIAQGQNGNLEYTLRIQKGDLAAWIKPGGRVNMEVESAAEKRPGMEGRNFDRGFDDQLPEGPGGGRGGPRGRGMRGGERDEDSASRIPPDKAIHFRFEIVLATKTTAP